ncbi:ABC transporter ATP-binding protein [Aerococcus sanguinicola]|uniref:ABC transporter n=2 Tax=Aerococcus TaxID=1375 RepID=A0A120I968_9LACT|nr:MULTISPECIES: ABC transporter ATP-binding protein [Aerococcus]AMB93998.1 ABC transporter [Aerococcus sanguinicola]OFT93566.1 ABC transporter [Aerococcus sp. HMSC23C02]PKZ20766.1 ABC transporter ATP-binding protein [Aerococcus sanguinicola]
MPKQKQKTLPRLLAYLGQYKFFLALSVLATLVIAACDIIAPRMMGDLTSQLFHDIQSGQAINFQAVGRLCLILVGLYLALAVFNFIQGQLLTYISQNFILRLREEVSHKVKHIPLAYFDQARTGDLLSRMTSDVEVLGKNIQQTISQVFYGIILLLGIIVMMLRISAVMTAIFFVTIPLSFFATRFITSRSQKYFRAKAKGLGAMVAYVEESFTGTDLIKAYNYEDRADKEFRSYNDKLYDVSYKASFMAGVLLPVMTFVSNMGYVAIAIVGGLLVLNQQILVGDVLAFIQYSQKMTRPINTMAEMANLLQETMASADRVFEFLDAPEEVECDEARIDSPIESISFDHVGFAYEAGHPIIKDLSLEVDQGQTIAIVGPTGAGKTTLINLLLRFYDVSKGAIRINGTDIRQVPRDNLRQHFGMVLQDTWLLQASIEENIRYGKSGASQEEVIQAAKQAHCYHFIESLPDGFDTLLNEEASNISQGQRQLLTIARAFISDPDILILDEATSSVDTRTEGLIQEAMANLMTGRTNFVIAHRLSTIVDADRILVLDQGDIVEQGSHQELLALNGTYAKLYQSQFAE